MALGNQLNQQKPLDVKGRILVPTTLEATALLTKADPNSGNSYGLFTGQPSSRITIGSNDGYKDIVGANEVVNQKLNIKQMYKARSARKKLDTKLKSLYKNDVEFESIMDSKSQLDAIALALSGYWGDKVTLTGLNPKIKRALNALTGPNQAYAAQGVGIHAFDTTEPALKFMVEDGIASANDLVGGYKANLHLDSYDDVKLLSGQLGPRKYKGIKSRERDKLLNDQVDTQTKSRNNLKEQDVKQKQKKVQAQKLKEAEDQELIKQNKMRRRKNADPDIQIN